MEPTEVPDTETMTNDGPRPRKHWSDFSRPQQVAIVLGATAELVLTAIAVRDLVRRPARQVRGRKLAWLVTFVVQPFGPIAYLLVGRRRSR